MFEAIDGHKEVGGGESVPQRVWQNPSLRGLCEGRENRGSAHIGEAPDSVRGLTRVQFPSRVNGEGYGWWLKVWTGTGRIVEM